MQARSSARCNGSIDFDGSVTDLVSVAAAMYLSSSAIADAAVTPTRGIAKNAKRRAILRKVTGVFLTRGVSAL